MFQRFTLKVSNIVDKLRSLGREEHAEDMVPFPTPKRLGVPTIWLLGKTGAGKTAIIKSLTGNLEAVIGNGYQPTTREATVYDLPKSNPKIRFIDTRGLGEADYDHSKDLRWHEQEADVIMLVMRVSDLDQADVIAAVDDVRSRKPIPLIIVQTCLHECYEDNKSHPIGYPFLGDDKDLRNPALPRKLRSSTGYQRQQFDGIKGASPIFVAVDLCEDYKPTDYGRDALVNALLGLLVEHAQPAERASALGSRLRHLWPIKSQNSARRQEARRAKKRADLTSTLREMFFSEAGEKP